MCFLSDDKELQKKLRKGARIKTEFLEIELLLVILGCKPPPSIESSSEEWKNERIAKKWEALFT